MKTKIILQLLSIISMVIGLFFFYTYQRLEKKEQLSNQKRIYQKKEIICFYLGIILEVIGLTLLMFI